MTEVAHNRLQPEDTGDLCAQRRSGATAEWRQVPQHPHQATVPKVGRLIAVVGPSGVGKDSVMAGLAQSGGFQLLRRVITRPEACKSEAFEQCSEAAFQSDLAAGRFCLHWQAHGLHYGIAHSELTCLWRGQDALVNLSRSALVAAQELVPRFAVLSLQARPEVLATRLRTRGREDPAGIAARLARDISLPSAICAENVIDLNNDGSLTETVQAAAAALSEGNAR